ncbi:protein YgfX [Motiliproteus sp. SC1-56]|uniref:protein YgfX n=1 Tax=Motiliproteus sp. SC1-56 TaxID=2799565 RepID=UPI001A8E98C0|nr:protein YgfX [Motiliproteus sp. SC1-56]
MAFQIERLDLTPSRRLIVLLALVYSAAAVAPFLSGLPLWLSLLLAIFVVGHGWWFFRRDVFLVSPDAVVALRWDGQGRWFIRLGDGREQAVSLGAGSVLVSWICLLELLPEGAPRRWLPVLADSGAADGVRQLRVRVRFPVKPGASGASRN